MSRKYRRQSGIALTLEEELENLRNDVGVLRRSVDSKSAAVNILRSELEKCQRERDKFKAMAEHSPSLAPSSSSLRLAQASAVTYPEVGRSAMLSPSEGTLAQLLSQAKQESKTLRLECTELRCKLHDAQADSKVLREELQRRDGCGPGRRSSKAFQAASSQLAHQEREQFINQMETLSAKCLALEGDVRGLVEEREELIKERDGMAHKLHRLNHILNVLMSSSSEDLPKRTVDLDAIITENRYLQERLKNSEDEKKQARISAAKYKAIIEKQRSPGATKLGGRSDGLIVTPKQVGELLQEYKGEMDGAAEGDMRSLCVALVDAINQRSAALKTQRRANKVLVTRIVELERRLVLSGKSSETADSEDQLCFTSSSAKLMEGYVPPSGPAPHFSPQILDDPHILQLIHKKQMERAGQQVSLSEGSGTSVGNSPIINGSSAYQVPNQSLGQNEAKDNTVNALPVQSTSPQRLSRRRRYSYEKACGDESLRLSFTETNGVYDFENGSVEVFDSPQFTKTNGDGILNSPCTLEPEGGSEVSDLSDSVQTNGIHHRTCISEPCGGVVDQVHNSDEENELPSKDTNKCQQVSLEANRSYKNPSPVDRENYPERHCVSRSPILKTKENSGQKDRVDIAGQTDRPLQPCNPYLVTLEASCNQLREDFEEIVPIDQLDSYIREVKAKQQKSKAGIGKKECLETDQNSQVKSDSNFEETQSNETKSKNAQEEEKNVRTKVTSQTDNSNNKPCEDETRGVKMENMSKDVHVSREMENKLDDESDKVKAVSTLEVEESMEGEVNGKTEEDLRCEVKSTSLMVGEGNEVMDKMNGELGKNRNDELNDDGELQMEGENGKLDDNCVVQDREEEEKEEQEEYGTKSGAVDDELKLCESCNKLKKTSSESELNASYEVEVLDKSTEIGEYCEDELNRNELEITSELALEETKSETVTDCFKIESCLSEKNLKQNGSKKIEPVTAKKGSDHQEMPPKPSEEPPRELRAPDTVVQITEDDDEFSRNTKSSCLNGEDSFTSVESQIMCLQKDSFTLETGKGHEEDDDDDNSFDLEMSDYDSDNDNLDETLLEWQQEFRKLDPRAAKSLPSPAHKAHKPKETPQAKSKLLEGRGGKGWPNKEGNDLPPALEALLQKAVGLAAENGIDCA